MFIVFCYSYHPKTTPGTKPACDHQNHLGNADSPCEIWQARTWRRRAGFGCVELDGYNMKPTWCLSWRLVATITKCLYRELSHHSHPNPNQKTLENSVKSRESSIAKHAFLVVHRILADVIPKNEHLAVVERSGWPVASTTWNKSGNDLQHAQLFQMLSVGIFGKVSNRLWFLRNSNGYQDSYRSGAVPKVSNVSVLLHSQQLGHSSVGRVAGNYHSCEMMAIQHTSSIPPQKITTWWWMLYARSLHSTVVGCL